MATIERTIPRLMEKSFSAYAENIMMWEKTDLRYAGRTYRQIQSAVHRFAAGLLTLGVHTGDRIALISEGRSDWVIAELGILYTGAINVPLSVRIDETAELKFRLAHSGCSMAIVSSNQASKISQIRRELPDLRCVVHLDRPGVRQESDVLLDELLSSGAAYLGTNKTEFDELWQSVRENDAANICYTSGTVADPKGIVLSHRNYTANLEQTVAMFPLPAWYCTLLILPWDHAFAHTGGIYTLASRGASMAAVQQGKTPMETLRNIPENIREIRPTFLLSVPSFARNLRKNIERGVREKGRVVERLFGAGLKTAYAYNGIGADRGTGRRALLKPLVRAFDLILFRKVRESLGGRLEFFVGGGALLDIEMQKFFYALGMPMYQGYGLTEAAPVISANTPGQHKLGSSGKIVPGLDVRICDGEGHTLPVEQAGEIVVRGENVMKGYWRNEKATRDSLRDGWLYTGDLGYLDRDGFLFVLGREKSLLISHDGEKYSPEGIEEGIVGHSLHIDQIMLYNDQSPYTVALVVPARDALLRWLSSANLSCDTAEGQTAALQLLASEIDAYRRGGKHAGTFPERWIPTTFALLEEPFTEQNRFLNSTLKMVRGRIAGAYRSRIDLLYTPDGKDIFNAHNRESVARLKI
jgi:long-chain acyl-CoA synthetase